MATKSMPLVASPKVRPAIGVAVATLAVLLLWPRINRRISNGELVFTPDATREEAERIVKGVNNVSKKIAQGIW